VEVIPKTKKKVVLFHHPAGITVKKIIILDIAAAECGMAN
jgi:hypothetical protein